MDPARRLTCLSAGCVLSLLGVASGCAATGGSSDAALGAPIEDSTPAALRSDRIDPLRPMSRAFVVIRNGEEGERLRMTITPGDEDGHWLMVRRMIQSDEIVRTDRFRRGEDGEAILLATVEHDRDLVTRFDPPLRILPRTLPPDESRTSDASLTVRPVRDPSTIRHSGEGGFRIELMGRERIEAGGETIEAYRVHTRLTVDLGVAQGVFEADRWWAEGVGLVAERLDERITVLGIPSKQTDMRIRLAEAPDERAK